ncbi:MAG: hypothetical protein DBY41_11360 [Clostridium sp.]|nr:MAG: hypothetical protein DBY41_11360 [Clostridium sp.]
MQKEITIRGCEKMDGKSNKVIKPMKNNENTKTTLSITIEEYRREEFLSKLEESKKQYKEGKVHSAKKVFKELREKYGY